MSEYDEIIDRLVKEIRFINKELLSIKEVADYYDISERSVRRFILSRKILTIKEPGIGVRIVKSALDDYFENRIQKRIEKDKKDAEFVQIVRLNAFSRNRNN